ncbi:MAG: DUF1146 domain-containing protein [Firmicutes bacterium]|nr:DUF1146 domain-containing protein [Bacillota bacterium]
MNVKLLLYILVIPFVMYALDGVNINSIFKKNKVIQARILYLMIIFALSYLLVNFIFDFYDVSKIF